MALSAKLESSGHTVNVDDMRAVLAAGALRFWFRAHAASSFSLTHSGKSQQLSGALLEVGTITSIEYPGKAYTYTAFCT